MICLLLYLLFRYYDDDIELGHIRLGNEHMNMNPSIYLGNDMHLFHRNILVWSFKLFQLELGPIAISICLFTKVRPYHLIWNYSKLIANYGWNTGHNHIPFGKFVIPQLYKIYLEIRKVKTYNNEFYYRMHRSGKANYSILFPKFKIRAINPAFLFRHTFFTKYSDQHIELYIFGEEVYYTQFTNEEIHP